LKLDTFEVFPVLSAHSRTFRAVQYCPIGQKERLVMRGRRLTEQEWIASKVKARFAMIDNKATKIWDADWGIEWDADWDALSVSEQVTIIQQRRAQQATGANPPLDLTAS
jgi:hypothetical protein